MAWLLFGGMGYWGSRVEARASRSSWSLTVCREQGSYNLLCRPTDFNFSHTESNTPTKQPSPIQELKA
jgi:hypothetical protein